MALTATVRHCKAHHCQSRLLEGCLAAPARAPPESRPSRLCPRGPPASVGMGGGEGGRHRPAGSSEGESPRTRFVRKHSVDFAIAPKSPANFYEQMCNQKKKKKRQRTSILIRCGRWKRERFRRKRVGPRRVQTLGGAGGVAWAAVCAAWAASLASVFLSHFSEDVGGGTPRALRRADRFISKKPAFVVGSAADPNGSRAGLPRSWRTGGTSPRSLPRPRPASCATGDRVERRTEAAAPRLRLVTAASCTQQPAVTSRCSVSTAVLITPGKHGPGQTQLRVWVKSKVGGGGSACGTLSPSWHLRLLRGPPEPALSGRPCPQPGSLSLRRGGISASAHSGAPCGGPYGHLIFGVPQSLGCMTGSRLC